jgi:hypothetical protein
MTLTAALPIGVIATARSAFEHFTPQLAGIYVTGDPSCKGS